MRNTLLLFSILFCLQSEAQDNLNCYIIKGKLEKNDTFKRDCGDQYPTKIAVVIEITLTNSEDIKRFGEKLYVAEICPQVPSDSWFDDKEYDIEIRDRQMWKWEITILNAHLFEKNKDKKEYWLENVCCKYRKINPCYPNN
ncbi:hypothetical protein [Flavobacterium sp. 25HG05S-40]|uniref:hypothetical protein n=1 Tax=Flavobacterium sp. 25HG05S-40 TaxID=3458682 RepID=UPI0040443470